MTPTERQPPEPSSLKTLAGAITLAHYRSTVLFERPFRFGHFPGNTLRGGLMLALRRVACRGATCRCRVGVPCDYQWLIEHPIRPEEAQVLAGSHAPPPVVLIPPPAYASPAPGEPFAWHFTLIGGAISRLPAIIKALIAFGRQGIGAQRVRFSVASIGNLTRRTSEPVFDGATQSFFGPGSSVRATEICEGGRMTGDAVVVTFETPGRFKHEKHLVTRLDYPILAAQLRRRVHHLAAFYGDSGDLPSAPLEYAGDEIVTRWSHLEWKDLHRRSERQHVVMQLGGLVGDVRYEGNVAPELPWLLLGQHLHVGKATDFGLGRYRLHVD